MSYQSVNKSGASDSQEKLNRLKLPKNMQGLRVLDIGCNEGFFCFEAKRRGAEYVLGIDVSQKFVELAKNNRESLGLDVEFRVANMMELDTSEKYDIIIFTSALHYIRSPKLLFNRLLGNLTPNGRLILECGVIDSHESTVFNALRSVDNRFFPTEKLLTDFYLSDYSVRYIGRSVNQVGDPVARKVFHCRLRQTTVVFLIGSSGIGKTSLIRDIKNALVVSTDKLFSPIPVEGKMTESDACKLYRNNLILSNRNIQNAWDQTWASDNAREHFIDILSGAISMCNGAPLITVEGYAVKDLARPVMQKLEGLRFWVIMKPRDAVDKGTNTWDDEYTVM